MFVRPSLANLLYSAYRNDMITDSQASRSKLPEEKPAKRSLEQVITDLCNAQGPGRTICPTDAAKAFAAERSDDELAWRRWLVDRDLIKKLFEDAGAKVEIK